MVFFHWITWFGNWRFLYLFTPDFFNLNGKYIFSYNYEILRQPNTYNFFIIYTQYEGLDGSKNAYTEAYYIRKFKIKSFSESNPYEELAVAHDDNNENDRIVNGFIMKDKNLLVILFLKYGENLYYKHIIMI